MRPASLLTLAGLLASAAVAQEDQPPPPPPEPLQAPAPLPPPPDVGPAVQAPPKIVRPKPRPAAAAVVPVPVKPEVIRSPVAVLQVLDKVTAETMRFEAPVGRAVRYKNLVVQVRACETRGYDDPEPRASAYLLIDTNSAGLDGRETGSQVFHGWMFASTPSLHALHHPIYDLWLIACSASAPST